MRWKDETRSLGWTPHYAWRTVKVHKGKETIYVKGEYVWKRLRDYGSAMDYHVYTEYKLFEDGIKEIYESNQQVQPA